MTSKQWRTTKRLLIMALMVDEKIRELEAIGVVMPQLEFVQSEIIMLALQINGISRHDDSVD